MRLSLRHIALAALAAALPHSAAALNCSASMTNINFGSVSVRSGVVNATSGTLTINCTGATAALVGVCVTVGAGSGGAGPGLSPRYMRRVDNAALPFELRPTGNGAAHGTLDALYLALPVVLGQASGSVPLFADITGSGVDIGTGLYSTTFSGAVSGLQITYGVAACNIGGQTAVAPDFTVSADVQSSCEADAAALNFGDIGQTLTGPVDAQTLLNVRCTSATSYAIRLDNGSGAGATGPEDRRMTFGGSSLSYGLYRDSARSQPWGNSPSNDVDAVGAGATQSFAVYGRIHGGQSALPGVYGDSVLVTIEYE